METNRKITLEQRKTIVSFNRLKFWCDFPPSSPLNSEKSNDKTKEPRLLSHFMTLLAVLLALAPRGTFLFLIFDKQLRERTFSLTRLLLAGWCVGTGQTRLISLVVDGEVASLVTVWKQVILGEFVNCVTFKVKILFKKRKTQNINLHLKNSAS